MVRLGIQEGHLAEEKETSWKSFAGHRRHGSVRDPMLYNLAWEAKVWPGMSLRGHCIPKGGGQERSSKARPPRNVRESSEKEQRR